jgi:hypothetical protein
MALDDAAVAEIQRLYADNKLTVAQIGERFGFRRLGGAWPARGTWRR